MNMYDGRPAARGGRWYLFFFLSREGCARQGERSGEFRQEKAGERQRRAGGEIQGRRGSRRQGRVPGCSPKTDAVHAGGRSVGSKPMGTDGERAAGAGPDATICPRSARCNFLAKVHQLDTAVTQFRRGVSILYVLAKFRAGGLQRIGGQPFGNVRKG